MFYFSTSTYLYVILALPQVIFLRQFLSLLYFLAYFVSLPLSVYLMTPTLKPSENIGLMERLLTGKVTEFFIYLFFLISKLRAFLQYHLTVHKTLCYSMPFSVSFSAVWVVRTIDFSETGKSLMSGSSMFSSICLQTSQFIPLPYCFLKYLAKSSKEKPTLPQRLTF